MTEVELQYGYCLQSVAKIAELKAKVTPSEFDLFDLNNNIDYLTQMLDSPIWTTEDLTPLREAIK